MANSEKLTRFLRTLGPGIMFAGTCIGGSHLVQSTRAGADYGFQLLFIILLANFFKYPFFEFASRYTNATGKSTLEGFSQEGKWTLYLYGIITFISMFIVTAAILFVTGGLMANLFGLDIEVIYWIGGLSVIVWVLLLIGKFNFLDSALKAIGVVLVISVVSATVIVIINGQPEAVTDFEPKDLLDKELVGFGFMIALMGWMPMGVDMSAWASIWTQERIKQTNYYPTLKETLLDFNIGYAITVFLALCFLTLGAYVFYGSGKELSSNAVVFSNQLVTLFTKGIGSWSYTIIAAAAFSTMFGTSLTLVDGYTRSMDRVVRLLQEKDTTTSKRSYLFWVSLTVIGGFLIILFGTTLKGQDGRGLINFKTLIDIATALSFLVAPIAAYLNFKIIYSNTFPKTHLPPIWLKALAIAGMVLLTGFSLAFIYAKFIYPMLTN